MSTLRPPTGVMITSIPISATILPTGTSTGAGDLPGIGVHGMIPTGPGGLHGDGVGGPLMAGVGGPLMAGDGVRHGVGAHPMAGDGACLPGITVPSIHVIKGHDRPTRLRAHRSAAPAIVPVSVHPTVTVISAQVRSIMPRATVQV